MIEHDVVCVSARFRKEKVDGTFTDKDYAQRNEMFLGPPKLLHSYLRLARLDSENPVPGVDKVYHVMGGDCAACNQREVC